MIAAAHTGGGADVSATRQTIRLRVPAEAGGLRLDRYLAQALEGHTRSALRRLIVDGRVTLDGARAAKPGVELTEGTRIEITATGCDADEAVNDLVRLVSSGFEED